MPPKTNTDLIRELGLSLAMLTKQVEQIEAKVDDLVAAQARIDESFTDMRIRMALVESKQTDLKAAHDEKDRRLWMIWVAVIGSLLTLAANIMLTAWKR